MGFAKNCFHSLLLRLIFTTILIFHFQSNYPFHILAQNWSPTSTFTVASNIVSPKPTTIYSYGPDVARAKKYVYLTAASYCLSITDWNCEHCKKSESLGYNYSSTLFNKSANTFGFIAVNNEEKEIVVVFRGSFSVANAIQDITVTQGDGMGGIGGSNKSGNGSAIKVHGGFLIAAKSLYSQVVEKLVALFKDNIGYSVVVTGHSLGAAIASLTLYMLMERIDFPSNFEIDPSSYSFFGYAEPRVGNQAYADYWNNQKIQVTRIVNKADIVPHLPTSSMGFVHHGTELWITPNNEDKICSKTVYEDPTCSNSLGTAYQATDHPMVWNVTHATECALKNPGNLMSQFVVPFSHS